MLIPKSISTHFNEDHFLNSDKSFVIIDDYNILGITKEATRYFLKEFYDAGVKKITIYYQVKQSNMLPDDKELEAQEKLGVSASYINYLLAFLKIRVPVNEDRFNRFKLDFSKYDKKIELALYFLDEFKKAGITINLRPYNSLYLRPPFHGRYWLSDNGGYIVDGSLNTYSNDIVLAQKMDQSENGFEGNFEIVSRFFINNIKNSEGELLEHDKIIELLTRIQMLSK